MKVLLAVGHADYSEIVRTLLANTQLEVLTDEVNSRKYLNEKVVIHQPDIVIIQENYLPSEYSTQEEKEAEILKIIENWRVEYNDSIRVVYFCVRDRKDAFLRQLIARNVLDIFNERSISGQMILEQLTSPAKYGNVSRFTSIGTVQYELVNDDESTKTTEAATPAPVKPNVNVLDELDELENTEPIEQQPSTKDKKRSQKEKNPSLVEKAVSQVASGKEAIAKGTGALIKNVTEKIPKNEKVGEMVQEIFIEDFINLMSEPSISEELSKATIIGTVLIAVAGVKQHLGSTHTALSLANFLAKKGHAVAVVECTESQDFDRIHSLYVGEKELLKKQNDFKINNINHFKYRPNTDLNELYSAYEYVIMDYSELESDSNFIGEFKRAHIRLVVCSADEWRAHWIDEFLKANRIKIDDCTFVAPAVSTEKAADFSELIRYSEVHALPIQDNPYEVSVQTEKVFSNLLSPFLKATPMKMVSKNTVIIAVVLSILATAAILTIFKYM